MPARESCCVVASFRRVVLHQCVRSRAQRGGRNTFGPLAMASPTNMGRAKHNAQDTTELIIHNPHVARMGRPPRKSRPKSKPGPKPARGTPRSAAIAVRTVPQLKKAAERAAAADRRSLSAWSAMLIIAALERPKKS